MGTIVRPTKPIGGGGGTSWIAGADLYANELNADIDTIYTDYNGNITNVNLSATAAVEGTKLADAPLGIPTTKYNALSVTKAKIAAASISSDKLDSTEYTNAGGLGAIASGATLDHDTGASNATRQALVAWYTGGSNITCGISSTGGTWHVKIANVTGGPITVNAGEIHLLHISKT